MELTQAQINRLTEIVTGEKPARAANAAKAATRFRAALAERIGEHLAARDADFIFDAEGFEIAEGNLNAVLEHGDEMTAISAAEAANRPAQDDPAPVSGPAPAQPEPAVPDAIRRARGGEDGPRDGSRARGIFNMLTRPGGATSAEMKDAGLGSVSVAIYAEPMAQKYGGRVDVSADGRVKRYAIIRPTA